MKKSLKSILGVTLLEIMLVLAIAALIIVMSIRYYQSAQTATAVQDMQNGVASMLATADSIGLAGGSYAQLTVPAMISSLPANMQAGTTGINTPWGAVTLDLPTVSQGSYNATLKFPAGAPAAACVQIAAFITNVAAQHMTTAATCSGSTVTWTINIAPNASGVAPGPTPPSG